MNAPISELMKLHIQGVWHNAHKFIRQPALIDTGLTLRTPAVFCRSKKFTFAISSADEFLVLCFFS